MKFRSTVLKGVWGVAPLLGIACTLLTGGSVMAQVPGDLMPPVGNVEILRAHGVGVQIYHSEASASSPTGFVWKFFNPEATLFNGGGKAIIHHFAGPSWQSLNNGSLVVGTVFKKLPSPDPAAIDWVLLTGSSHSGNGMMSNVSFIQRINTTDGLAPAELPTAAGLEARQPYTATYVFFAPSNESSSTAKTAARR